MKKKITLGIALFLSAASFAQQIHFGIAGGVTSYSVKGDASKNLNQGLGLINGLAGTGPVTGFYGGGYTNITLGNHLSLEPGLYYSTKGYALTGLYTFKDIDILSADASASLHSSYIELPLLLKADFKQFHVFAGPQIAYLTNADIKISAGLAGFNLYNDKINVTRQLNNWDAAITGGIGYQFTNGIRITGSYDRGLSKIDGGKNIKSYNQGFKIGMGYKF